MGEREESPIPQGPATSLRPMFLVPSGGTVQIDLRTGGATASVPLWKYWLRIAEENARLALEYRPTDHWLDQASERLAELRTHAAEPGFVESDNHEAQGIQEVLSAMVTIGAAAHSVDGFYGALSLVLPDKRSHSKKPKRSRMILEGLKLGFAIGKWSSKWLTDLDWLFATRDSIVHHSDLLRPCVVSRTTSETLVVGGPEVFHLDALDASRAYETARDVIGTCLDNPKPAIRSWAERVKDDAAPPKQ